MPAMPTVDVQAVKTRIDLAELFTSRGLKLVRRGANLVTLCPFHRDSRPSLVVNTRRQLWHCFGCQAAGDAISFVERFDQVDFKIALARITPAGDTQPAPAALPLPALVPATPAPVPAPAPTSPASAARRTRAARPLETVVTYYQKTLARNTKAQAYLRTRGLTSTNLLTASRAGFADGSLKSRLASRPELARQLADVGFTNDRGNEMFYLSLVFPILDPEGRIVSLYGRNTRPDTEIPHLYLPGPRRGVFNYPGLKGSNGSVILTEGILDALSLLQLGFPNTSCVWGTNGFTADILAALQRTGIKTVFVTYDNDHAGNPAAEQLAHRLAPHGIATRKIELPTKDPNDFLIAGHTADDFAALLEIAQDITPGRDRPATPLVARTPASPLPPSAAPVAESTSPKPPSIPATKSTSTPDPATAAESAPPPPLPHPTPPSSLALLTRFGPRTYRLTPPRPGAAGLRVTLRLELDGKALLDRFDLASDRARSSFVTRAAKLFPGTDRHLFEEDLFALIDQLEERQLKKESSRAPVTPEAVSMSPDEEADARGFLESPTLLADLEKDLEKAGLVGEATNKVLLYLIATSRALEAPLSAVLLSGSSAGKSHLLKTITDLMPPEGVFRYTRISAQALFYKEHDALKHKLVLIEEAEGASDADYPLRVMQSDRTLRNLVTIKDPQTGQMTTQETEVEGPIALLVSSTAAAIHYENATRSFELAIDESSEQTAQILAAQRRAKTLEGLQATRRAERVRRRHQNAQRLLAPATVVNNYADRLSFPTSPLRLRREQPKYLSLIEAVTFLHQHQRPKRELPGGGDGGEPTRYIETTKADIRTANRLFASVIVDTVGELSHQSRHLLPEIARLLRAKRTDPGDDVVKADLAEPAFPEAGLTRREIREALGWSDYQLCICLEQLEKLEYVATVTGRQGKRYLYALTPQGFAAADDTDDLDSLARRFGLTDPDTLP